MSVWDLATIRAVQSLHASITMSDEMIISAHEGLMDWVIRGAVRELQEAAYGLAVEIAEGDVQVVEQFDDPARSARVFVVAWRPSTLEVEFVGGPRDGERRAWHDAGGPLPLVMTGFRPSTDLVVQEDVQPSVVSYYTVEYWLSGWREEGRRWVYSLSGKPSGAR